MSQQINLLNPDLVKIKVWIGLRMIVFLALVFLVLLFFVYSWASFKVDLLDKKQKAAAQSLSSVSQQLTDATRQYAMREPSKELLADIVDAETTLKDYQNVLDFINNGNLGKLKGFSEYMEAFSRQSIRGVWLTGFAIDDSVSQIQISGRALHSDLIAHYINSLGQEAVFKGRNFSEFDVHEIVQPANAKVNQAVVADGNTGIVEFKLQSETNKLASGNVKPFSAGN